MPMAKTPERQQDPLALERHLVQITDAALVAAQRVQAARPTRENSLAITKLEEAGFRAVSDEQRKRQDLGS